MLTFLINLRFFTSLYPQTLIYPWGLSLHIIAVKECSLPPHVRQVSRPSAITHCLQCAAPELSNLVFFPLKHEIQKHSEAG